MITEEEKTIIKEIGKYKYNQMKEKKLSYSEYLIYLKEKEQEKMLRKKMGQYEYKKMKNLGLNYSEYQEYKKNKEQEKILKQKIGYKDFNRMKKLGLNYEQYKQFKKEQKFKKYEKSREKNKTRYKTIRYIERYCNLEMKCQICNAKKNVQIHHPNYKDYLKINLLCIKHHNALHRFELIPPPVINLEEIAIAKPIQKEKMEYIKSQMMNIKNDIMKNKYTYSQLSEKYGIAGGTIKRHLEKDKDWDILKDILYKSGKRKMSMRQSNNKANPLQKYRIENNLTVKELSEIIQIPAATITAIENNRTNINKVKSKTKQKLKKILII